MASHETLQAGLEAVGALMTVLAGDGKRDKGLMSRTVEGRQHVQTCNRGLYLYPGLRAPPGLGATAQRFRQHIARALLEAGDPAGARVVIVEARPGQE